MRTLALTLISAVCISAQSLSISTPSPHQVLQRDKSQHADLSVRGTASGLNGKPIEVRISDKSGPLRELNWISAGKVEQNQWAANLRIPVGGPYRVDVRSGTVAAAIHDVFAGDLWVLGGQSNMEGYGDLADVQQPHGIVQSFDMTDRWVLAEEPLHFLVGAADKIHWPLNAQKQPEKYEGARLASYLENRKKGGGLALPFAVELTSRTGVPIGLIPCAHGGTSMDQWNPDLRDKGGESLYGATVRRIRLVGGKVRGVLWYQGESDASPRVVADFQKKFERLVSAFRSDTGQPDMPFYYVQIGRFINGTNLAEWNTIQEMQRLAEPLLAPGGMVSAIDLGLDDLIHVGTQDHKRLGHRVAVLACLDLFPGKCSVPERGPRPTAAVFRDGVLRVDFSGVNGRLRSDGRISGFSIHDATGTPLPMIYKATLDSKFPARVQLHLINKPPEGARLHYGAGKDPYCNLRDSADMAVPVFGPMAIGN